MKLTPLFARRSIGLLCAVVLASATPLVAEAQTHVQTQSDDDDPMDGRDAQGRVRHESKDGFVWLTRRTKGYFEIFDASGKVIIPLSRRYTLVSYDYTRHRFRVARRVDKDTYYRGLCAADGTEMMSPDRGYTYCIYIDKSKTYHVKKGDCVGYCDSLGREFFSPDLGCTYCKIERKNGSLGFSVGRDGAAGYYDAQCREVVPLSRGYTSCRCRGDYFAVERGEHQCGICDKEGKEIVPTVWYSIVWNNSVGAYMGKRDLNSRWERIDLDNPYPNN